MSLGMAKVAALNNSKCPRNTRNSAWRNTTSQLSSSQRNCGVVGTPECSFMQSSHAHNVIFPFRDLKMLNKMEITKTFKIYNTIARPEWILQSCSWFHSRDFVKVSLSSFRRVARTLSLPRQISKATFENDTTSCSPLHCPWQGSVLRRKRGQLLSACCSVMGLERMLSPVPRGSLRVMGSHGPPRGQSSVFLV